MRHDFPNDEILADYASGSLSAGMSLLVASHLTYSPESRRRVEGYESIGGAILAGMPADDAAPPARDAVLARLDLDDDETGSDRIDRAAARPGSVMPAPLRVALGGDETAVPWKFRLPGLSEYVLEGFGEDDEEVSLLRARPGAPLFSHTHSGVETTLVLSGKLEDRGEVYSPGEVTIATDEVDHRPRIVGEDQCICLIVMSGSLRFTGRFSRALNLIAE